MMIHPNLLDSRDSLLLIIDVQQRLTAAMSESDASLMVSQLGKILQAVKILEIPVLVTEQYPQGLGATLTEIMDYLPDDTGVFAKTGFSCCAADGFLEALQASGRKQLILCGLEAHVCVLQTALELLSRGFQVYVLDDAVCARRIKHKVLAMQRLQQQGVTLSCVESVLFEWLRDAKHMHFKTISSLIR
ncbi:isochorismatase family protein [Methylomonas sp. AM2-LC]|uniref:isochorismatase family protein n=1 Tax=Methylomonas sp. AM2-LC TaxID=3153301 RepID=UPI00326708D6